MTTLRRRDHDPDQGFTLIELGQRTNGTYPATIAAGSPAGTSGAACTGQTISVGSGTAC